MQEIRTNFYSFSEQIVQPDDNLGRDVVTEVRTLPKLFEILTKS